MRFFIMCLFSFVFLNISQASDPLPVFQIDGQMIRPSCIAAFNLGVATRPFVNAVDLTECQNSVLMRKTVHSNTEGKIYFYNNDKDAAEGMYAYKVYGMTDMGVYVVHTFEVKPNGSLSDMLLFLELSSKRMPIFVRAQSKQDKPALVAILRGYVIGGDRCSGGVAGALVRGNIVTVRQYPYVNSALQCQGEKEYTIDTATWAKGPQ